jgi:hypothetical protein
LDLKIVLWKNWIINNFGFFIRNLNEGREAGVGGGGRRRGKGGGGHLVVKKI